MTLRARAVLSLLLTLAACATPAIQPPMTPPPGFAGPSLAADAVIMDDGVRLPLARWAPEGEPWAVIVALHGMNDSRASFRLAGPWWAEQGIETGAIDQRGFGEAPGRGVWAGGLAETALVDGPGLDALLGPPRTGEAEGGAAVVHAGQGHDHRVGGEGRPGEARRRRPRRLDRGRGAGGEGQDQRQDGQRADDHDPKMPRTRSRR